MVWKLTRPSLSGLLHVAQFIALSRFKLVIEASLLFVRIGISSQKVSGWNCNCLADTTVTEAELTITCVDTQYNEPLVVPVNFTVHDREADDILCRLARSNHRSGSSRRRAGIEVINS